MKKPHPIFPGYYIIQRHPADEERLQAFSLLRQIGGIQYETAFQNPAGNPCAPCGAAGAAPRHVGHRDAGWARRYNGWDIWRGSPGEPGGCLPI